MEGNSRITRAAWVLVAVAIVAVMTPGVLSRDVPLARAGRILTQDTRGATINNDLLKQIIDSALGKVAGGGWEVDLQGTSDWYNKYFCCKSPKLGVSQEPLTDIRYQDTGNGTTALVYGSYTCNTPGVVKYARSCQYTISTSTANSVSWSNSKTEGFKVGLEAKWSAKIPFTDIGAEYKISADFSFSNTDSTGGGTVTTDQSTATCTMPSLDSGAACYECVMIYQEVSPTILATARAILSGYIGIRSPGCTNPTELHKYIPDDGKCHYYRLISIANILDLAVVKGVISPSDFVIDRSSGNAYMDTQITVKARAGYNFQSTVKKCDDPILDVAKAGDVLDDNQVKALTGK